MSAACMRATSDSGGGSGSHAAPATAPAVADAASETQVGAAAAAAAPKHPGRLRLAIVGDVHGAWRPDREAAALELLGPDLTLLVGDFGNEDVELVQQVAELPRPKAVILGNHDAWYTMTGRRFRRSAPPPPPSQRTAASSGRAGSPAAGPAAMPVPSGPAAAAGSAAGASTAAAATAAAGPAAATAPAGSTAAARAANFGSDSGPEADLDDVGRQLAALGSSHVGYGTMRLDERGYAVVGARPFSKGGRDFKSIRAFMEGLYGVTSMEESAHRIVQVAQSAPEAHPLIFMAHNGPAGLGSRHFDPCGVDWEPGAGDHGDPDLQSALATLHRAGRRVALVTFGHMHHSLHPAVSRGAGSTHRLRRMVALDPATGTVFLNAATVPRVTPAPTTSPPPSPPPPPPAAGKDPLSPKSYGSGRRARAAAKAAAAAARAAVRGGAGAAAGAAAAAAARHYGQPATLHHFVVAELQSGEVLSARDVWVQVTPVVDETAGAVLEAAVGAALGPSTAASAAGSSAQAQPTRPEAAGSGSNGAGAGRGDAGDGGSTEGGDEEVDGDEAEAEDAAAGPRRVGDFVVQVAREHIVLRTVRGAEGRGVVKFVWDAHDQKYVPYVLGTGDGGGNGGGGEDGRAAADAAEVRAAGKVPVAAAPAASR